MSPEVPLVEGEHVDLDNGQKIQRDDDGVSFTISEVRGSGRTDHVHLTMGDVKTLAELAGYTVTDEP